VFVCNRLTKAIKWPLHSEERDRLTEKVDKHFASNTEQPHTQLWHFSQVAEISHDILPHFVSAAVPAEGGQRDVLQARRAHQRYHITHGNIRTRSESPARLRLQTTSSRSPSLLCGLRWNTGLRNPNWHESDAVLKWSTFCVPSPPISACESLGSPPPFLQVTVSVCSALEQPEQEVHGKD